MTNDMHGNATALELDLGAWDLVICWSLGLGHWGFPPPAFPSDSKYVLSASSYPGGSASRRGAETVESSSRGRSLLHSRAAAIVGVAEPSPPAGEVSAGAA